MITKEATSDVLVQTTHKGLGVFANRIFYQGETVVIGKKVNVLPERTIYSLQVDFDLHIDLDSPAKLINHSCQPNTGVQNNEFGGYNFIALTEIAKGQEITFDYETTEYYSISIVECLCGSSQCRKKIQGFHALPLEIKKSYGEFIGDYLKNQIEI